MKFAQNNHPPILFGPTPFWHLRVAQLGVQIMPTTLILDTPRPPPSGFLDLPTALCTMQAHYKSVPRVT